MTTRVVTLSWCEEMTESIRCERERIFLSALSLLPPRNIKSDPISRWWLALADAKGRGVSITFALPASTVQHAATMRNDAAAGMLSDIGIAAVKVPPRNLLHAKTVRFGAGTAWVGSGNFTAAAAHHNLEVYMVTDEERSLRELDAFHTVLLLAAA